MFRVEGQFREIHVLGLGARISGFGKLGFRVWIVEAFGGTEGWVRAVHSLNPKP